ncbi:MAG: 23S rRNA (uracil(1939)-C(5))-methyltransferase RlmD [Bacteroidales bacterium]|nr:23S rRNA (uracil(1939)-C(5))-methyltransferase RlmD [Bacteroidales bacterium]
MRKKKKDYPLIEDVLISDAGAEGKAIAKIDGMVVFVPFVVPGDVVDLQILKKRKSYADGRAVAIKQYSDRRVSPKCPHFGICGGCKWQTLNYADQLIYKEKQVRDNLERIGQVDTMRMRPICGSENIFYYRNKLEYTFSNKAWRANIEAPVEDADAWGALGFHIPMLFDKVLHIEHCALQANPSNAIRLALRDYAIQHKLPCYDIRNHTGYLRNLMIRSSSTGEWMVVVVVAEKRDEWLFPMLDFLHERFPEITSLQYIINTKFNDSYTDLEVIPYKGKPYISERMEGYNGQAALDFVINPKSFYQTNSQQAQRLYSFVAEFAELKGHETVYDLYTGTGTIALFLASMCQKVVGIEYVEEAIADARQNAERNGFSNTAFYAGDMAKVLTSDFVAENGHPDIVITDPPRAGMHEKVIEQLLLTQPQKIVYVSCNPATQARDIQLLSAKYDVGRIQPVDMFPHTQHVENVAELLLRE